MQSTSKEELTDLLRFVERQTAFAIRTTEKVKTYHDFLTSDDAMVFMYVSAKHWGNHQAGRRPYSKTIIFALPGNSMEEGYWYA